MLINNLLRKLFGHTDEPSAREAIEEIITEENDTGNTLHQEERQLMSNILKLRELTAEDVMIPRADMVSVQLTSTPSDIRDLVSTQSYSRLPVFGENIDDIRGFVHVKDVAFSLGEKGFSIKDHLSQILFVPTSIPVVHLLSKMRQDQVPIAIVVDEYGGTDGLVTAWDILREIIGNMQGNDEDELRLPAKILRQDDGTVVADARVTIDDLEETLGIKLSTPEIDEEADTVGGLVMYLAGRVPDRKEIILAEDGTQFEVLDANPRTILAVRIYPSS